MGKLNAIWRMEQTLMAALTTNAGQTQLEIDTSVGACLFQSPVHQPIDGQLSGPSNTTQQRFDGGKVKSNGTNVSFAVVLVPRGTECDKRKIF